MNISFNRKEMKKIENYKVDEVEIDKEKMGMKKNRERI